MGVISERVHSDMVEPDIKGGVIKAIALLGEQGAEVETVSLPLEDHGYVIFNAIHKTELASIHHRWIRERLKDFDHNIQIRQIIGSITPAQAYYKAQKLRSLLRQQTLELLKRVDVLVLPTSSIPASIISTSAVVSSKEDAKAALFPRRFLTGASLAGLPAISVPCGFTSSQPPGSGGAMLPFGLQIVGRPFEEGDGDEGGPRIRT